MPNNKTPDYTIQISATKTTPYPPTLSDGTTTSNTEDDDKKFTTEVGPGNTIQWTIAGDISSIEKITFDSEKPNYFSQLPTADNQWTARVRNSGNGSKEEDSYTIEYNVTDADGNPFSQDPIIKMKN